MAASKGLLFRPQSCQGSELGSLFVKNSSVWRYQINEDEKKRTKSPFLLDFCFVCFVFLQIRE
jgi:hypothetical protein